MTASSEPGAVRDDEAAHRFLLTEEGQTAFADYERRGGVLIIRHVESPLPLRGAGTAGRLMAGVCAEARRRGERIRPLCSYAAAYMRRHPETRDLID